MNDEIATKERAMSWHQNQYAIETSNPRKAWDVDHIIRELTRVPENSHHVPAPLKPVSVFGIEVETLDEYVKDLKARASLMTEPYTLRGVTRKRKQSSIKPILMVGIASYPEPEMRDTADRRRWISLVVDAVKTRVEAEGGRLVAAVLHLDEGMAHLHCIADNWGALIRNWHWGHVAGDAEPVKANKGKAYRAGCVKIQDWFFETVGSKMGWLRNRPEGEQMPRMSPSQSNRIRQKKLEDQALKIEAESRRLLRQKHRLEEQELMSSERKAELAADAQRHQDQLDDETARIHAREIVLQAREQAVAQVVLAQTARKSGIDKEWEILARKANQIKIWEAKIRAREERTNMLESLIHDQIAWEEHRRRGAIPKPSPGGSSSRWDDGDLDDVPF